MHAFFVLFQENKNYHSIWQSYVDMQARSPSYLTDYKKGIYPYTSPSIYNNYFFFVAKRYFTLSIAYLPRVLLYVLVREVASYMRVKPVFSFSKSWADISTSRFFPFKKHHSIEKSIISQSMRLRSAWYAA